MFFGIPQRDVVDIYGFYFEKYILGYLVIKNYDCSKCNKTKTK